MIYKTKNITGPDLLTNFTNFTSSSSPYLFIHIYNVIYLLTYYIILFVCLSTMVTFLHTYVPTR